MGVACIGTRVVGSSDAVRDGETGLLVGPEDPADLAAAIVALAGDAGRRRTLAAGGLRFAREQGDRRTMTDRLHALYADLESRATRQAS